jgi:hypothetical protein
MFITRGQSGEDFLLPASPRPEKSFPRFAPPLIFIFRLRPASPRKNLSPLRPAPLSQDIFTNSTDTKDRNGKDFLLPTPLRPEKSFPHLAPKKVFPTSPRPVSSFYFSSPLRPAPIPRPVSISVYYPY